jgi:hypothetical protein
MRKMGLKRIFLHASSITFPPMGKSKAIKYEASLPEDLQTLLDKLA